MSLLSRSTLFIELSIATQSALIFRAAMGVATFVLLAIIGLPLLGILSLALSVRKTRLYFQKKGIPYSSSAITGFFKLILGTNNVATNEDELYSHLLSTKSSYVGMADVGGTKNWYIMDLDLIRHIMVKDFDHFVNRREIGNKNSNKYLSRMLTFMSNDDWRYTRAKLSTTFTTNKICRYFAIFDNSSRRMDAYIKEHINYPTTQRGDVDLTQIIPKYTLDVIANCAFGMDSKSFEVPPEQMSTFERMSKQFGFHFDVKFVLRMMLIFAAPKVADWFGVDMMDWEAQKYYEKVIKTVLKHRRESGERREDFLQMLLDIQAGVLKQDEESRKAMINNYFETDQNNNNNTTESSFIKMDDDDILANGMLFLNAGFDTTLSLWLLVVYCLALEQDVQEKLYQEVTSVLNKHNGKMTYESIFEMTYLDMVVNETLRLHSPANRTERVCTHDYTIPGTDIVIEKGNIAVFTICGIQRDPRHFPNPEKFIPERFSVEGKANRHPCAFLPFGHGPRSCLGMRFALIEVKASLVQIVKSFHLEPCARTKIPMEFNNDPVIKPKDSLFLKMTVRKE